MSSGDQTFANGAGDPQFAYAHMKPNSALPAQLGAPPTSNGGPEWNWNSQTR